MRREPAARAASHHRDEAGSALLLVPTAFVIVIVLAAFTVNSALASLAQQELERTASAAANDAVSAIERGAFYGEGAYRIDTGLAEAFAARVRASKVHDSVRDVELAAEWIDDDTIEVAASGRPRVAAWRILPWLDHMITVRVRATAVHR